MRVWKRRMGSRRTDLEGRKRKWWREMDGGLRDEARRRARRRVEKDYCPTRERAELVDSKGVDKRQ